jgi:magnesium-transporting ATPase (P-type)
MPTHTYIHTYMRTCIHSYIHTVVPADVLLLNGEVVSNEAILTGEATPQQKTSIAHRAPDEILCLKRHADTGRLQSVCMHACISALSLSVYLNACLDRNLPVCMHVFGPSDSNLCACMHVVRPCDDADSMIQRS